MTGPVSFGSGLSCRALQRFELPFKTQASASIPKKLNGCSTRSIQPSPMVWAWDCPSAARLLRHTVDVSGQLKTPGRAQRSNLHCLQNKETRNDAAKPER